MFFSAKINGLPALLVDVDDTFAVLLEVVDVGEELEEEDVLSGAVVVASNEDVVETAEVVLVRAKLLVMAEDELDAVNLSRV